MSEINLRKILLDDLKQAREMLMKYETRLLEGTAEADQRKQLEDGVAYWRSVSQQVRNQIFETKTEP